MYKSEGTSEERDLNLQILSFFVVEFSKDLDCYVQISTRMSLENANNLCVRIRKGNPLGDFKVHGELENF